MVKFILEISWGIYLFGSSESQSKQKRPHRSGVLKASQPLPLTDTSGLSSLFVKNAIIPQINILDKSFKNGLSKGK